MVRRNEALKSRRAALGWSQRQLAAEAGVAPTTVNYCELYGHQPTPETRQKIANALGVDPDALWPEKEKAGA